MKKFIIKLIGCAVLLTATIGVKASTTDTSVTDSTKIYYQKAFDELKDMLEGKLPADFERAVFVSENAHWDNKYSYKAFQIAINDQVIFIQYLARANDQSNTMDFSVKVKANGRFSVDDLLFTETERKEMYYNTLGNWAIFKFITDTTMLSPYTHIPFSYSTHDPFGMGDWANTQVFNLLRSGKNNGNCFALTALYKILANRMNVEANVCTAPQHIYIQHKDIKGDWYNVELATAGHPGDGKIQTLTYSTNQAVKNGIALRTLDEKQNIGLCLINLAKSYQHRFNTEEDDFMLQCAELVLKHDPLNLNALLLKQQVLDAQVTNYALNKHITNLYHLRQDQEIAPSLGELEKHLANLHHLGYVPMPLYMQEIVLNGFKDSKDVMLFNRDKNPSPFTTIQPKDKEDAKVVSISGGMFQEMFEPKNIEKYGHFTYSNTTGGIVLMDVKSKTDFIIDPVAFAYDFGARMYDARLGRFISVDPLTHQFPAWSPYVGMNDNPIFYTDPDGKAVRPVNKDARNIVTASVSQFGEAFIHVINFNPEAGVLSASLGRAAANPNAATFKEFKGVLKGANIKLSKSQISEAFNVFSILQSREVTEVAVFQKPGESFTTGPGEEGTIFVEGVNPSKNQNLAVFEDKFQKNSSVIDEETGDKDFAILPFANIPGADKEFGTTGTIIIDATGKTFREGVGIFQKAAEEVQR